MFNLRPVKTVCSKKCSFTVIQNVNDIDNIDFNNNGIIDIYNNNDNIISSPSSKDNNNDIT